MLVFNMLLQLGHGFPTNFTKFLFSGVQCRDVVQILEVGDRLWKSNEVVLSSSAWNNFNILITYSYYPENFRDLALTVLAREATRRKKKPKAVVPILGHYIIL